MKVNNLIYTLGILILISCSTTKAIKIPCSNVKSDKDYFRANQSANSQDLANSRDMALFAAKDRLAGLINTKMKNVSQRYIGDRKIANKSEFNQKFESMTRSIVDQTLLDVNITCEKTELNKKDNNYSTYIAIECSKETIYNGVNKGLSNDQKLRQDYDAMKFKEIFDDEMEKLEKEQP